MATSNDTERDFFRASFQNRSTNVSSVAVARVDIDLIAATTGPSEVAVDPSVAAIQTPPARDDGSVACDVSAQCVTSNMDAGTMVDYLVDVVGVDSNPCGLLNATYGCQVAGCACPYTQCDSADGCLGSSCDNFAFDSCAALEANSGCDCTGCACSAGGSCPNSCMGMSCADLQVGRSTHPCMA